MNIHEITETITCISMLKVGKLSNLETDPTYTVGKCQRQGLKSNILTTAPRHVCARCDFREVSDTSLTQPLEHIPSTEAKAAGTLNASFSFIFLIELNTNYLKIPTSRKVTTLYKPAVHFSSPYTNVAKSWRKRPTIVGPEVILRSVQKD